VRWLGVLRPRNGRRRAPQTAQMIRLKGAFLPMNQLPGQPGGKGFLRVFLFKNDADGRRV
jgi:hypothetical protein